MGLTIQNLRKINCGDGTSMLFSRITADTSYPSGGYLLTPSMFGLPWFSPESINTTSAVLHPIIVGRSLATSLLLADVDSSSYLHLYYPVGGAGTNPTALAAPSASGTTIVIPVGSTNVTSTAAQPSLTTTDPVIVPGQAIEVPPTTDVHTFSCVAIVFGG